MSFFDLSYNQLHIPNSRECRTNGACHDRLYL